MPKAFRRCGAKTSRGGRCLRAARPGQMRCHYHGGGRGTGRHRSEDAHHSKSLAKARAAVTWPHAQKSAPGGLVRAATAVRGRDGRFVAGKATKEQKGLMQHARDAETEINMVLENLPAVPDKPPAEMTNGELFSDNLRETLLFNREVLKRPTDWGDPELLKLKKEIALSTQAQAVRIRVAELHPPAARGGSVEEFYRRYDGGSSEKSKP